MMIMQAKESYQEKIQESRITIRLHDFFQLLYTSVKYQDVGEEYIWSR